MSIGFAKRVVRELADLRAHPIDRFALLFDEANLSQDILGLLVGPPDTPYADGLFTFTISLPLEYPFKGPMLRVFTPIFHPNCVHEQLCADLFKGLWVPSMTLAMFLREIDNVLRAPNFDDVYNVDAGMAQRNGVFEEVARKETEKFAQ